MPSLGIAQAKVMIALPWMKICSPITAFCVANLLARRRMTSVLNYGDSFVSHSRSTCAALFLKSDCDWLVQVDDDMVVPFGDAKWFNANTGFNLPEKFAGLNVINRLLSHNKTFIGAAYFGRHPHGRGMWAEACSGNAEYEDFSRTIPRDEIQPTRWCATGALLIHRSVFLDIEKRWPRLGRDQSGDHSNFYASSEDTALDVIDECCAMLNKGPLDGQIAMKVFQRLEATRADIKRSYPLGVGEDVLLSQRAMKCGHQPFVDLGAVAGHVGHQVWGPKNTSRKK